MLQIQEKNAVVMAKGTTDASRGNMDIYVFIVDGMLVDTGPKVLLKEFIPFFESSDYEQVVITHHHEDHTGGARWIEENKGVPIYIHQDAIELCSRDGEYPFYRKYAWGERDAFVAKPLSHHFETRTGKWEAIHTPDHAFDHMVLLNHSTGSLFSGDLFVTARPKIMLSFESVPIIMESIRKVLTYDFVDMYCNHAGHIKNGKTMLKKKLDYMENYSGQILDLYDRGWSKEEIQQELMPPNYPIIKFSNHEWDTMHFITSVLAYHRS